MKHKTVKSTLAAIAVMAIGNPAFGSSFSTVISEEFDGPTYAFSFENFGSGADYTASQDTGSVLSGANSAKLDIVSSGGDWWAIQVRSGDLYLDGHSILSVSFDIKSTAALGFNFVIEGQNPSQNFPVSLLAGETKHYSFNTAELVNEGNHIFIFGLGASTAGAAEVWIDNVQIEVVSSDPLFTLPLLEEFDEAPNGEKFGLFSFKNYPSDAGADAIYSFSQDTSSVLSGTNSAYMNITNSGSDWWKIQVRREGVRIETNTIVGVSFRIKSTADISFLSRLETPGIASEDHIVTVSAGQTTNITYETGTFTNEATSTFMLALGNSTAGAAEVWIDRVKLRKWVPFEDIGDITINPLSGTNGLALAWNTTEGYDYALETKSNLPMGTWATNQIVPGVDGSVTVTTAVDQVQSFYRVTTE